MPFQTSKKIESDTPATSNPTEMDTGVGSDKWMLVRGAIPMTPEESKAHAHFFSPCAKREETKGARKIVDLIKVLQAALMRR